MYYYVLQFCILENEGAGREKSPDQAEKGKLVSWLLKILKLGGALRSRLLAASQNGTNIM